MVRQGNRLLTILLLLLVLVLLCAGTRYTWAQTFQGGAVTDTPVSLLLSYIWQPATVGSTSYTSASWNAVLSIQQLPNPNFFSFSVVPRHLVYPDGELSLGGFASLEGIVPSLGDTLTRTLTVAHGPDTDQYTVAFTRHGAVPGPDFLTVRGTHVVSTHTDAPEPSAAGLLNAGIGAGVLGIRLKRCLRNK